MKLKMSEEFYTEEEKNKIVRTILKESRNRDKQRDHSFLDQDFDEVKEAITIIDNYKNKSDLAKQFIEAMPLYYDESKIWWRWKEKLKRWEMVDEVDILNLVNWSSYADVISNKERTEIINAFKQQARKNKPKDPKNTWIQFKGEIIDLDTGERFEATSEYFVKNPIPFGLGRTPDTPNMDLIFEQWVGKDYVKTLYEIISYCLLPDYPIHRLFCFIGGGMNGKSCFLSLLRKFIGEYNCCSTELDVLLASRFEKTRLHNKLICQMGETNFNEMKKTSILKSLTGGDLIGFEYKNKKPFESKNYAKIIIATNSLPTTTDKTIGFYRRWLIVDFPNKFSEKKDILLDIPLEEYENLGTKCIGLLCDLLRNREFYNEGSIEERMKRYESKSDFLNKFLYDFVEVDHSGYITSADFSKKFNSWCKENNYREMSEQTIVKSLKEMGYYNERKYFNWLHDGKGGQLRCWIGIKWKD